MDDPALWHRLQFAFTITYHYLFPQITMGLAWFLVFSKWRALRTGDERYAAAARFWARIFGLNFAVGVVTGIPMEFQSIGARASRASCGQPRSCCLRSSRSRPGSCDLRSTARSRRVRSPGVPLRWR
jgi:hypothetical protein